MVKWEKPEMDSWKLNTDGSYIANQGRAGTGGVVRNRDGQMLMAFAAPIQFLTNSYSETQAALHGIIWCCQQNFQKLFIKLDSLFVVDMILGNCSIPWRLQEAISQIRNNIQAHNITVQHCLREANEVADLLSKHATTLTEEVIFLWECNLPREVMGALRMDRMQVPSFRIRAEKHSAWIFHPP
ncbi:hypothetical protein P3L10_009540 [Capsicum annuum]